MNMTVLATVVGAIALVSACGEGGSDKTSEPIPGNDQGPVPDAKDEPGSGSKKIEPDEEGSITVGTSTVEQPVSEEPFLELTLDDGSRPMGSAYLRPTRDGTRTLVVVQLRQGADKARTASIQEGSCDDLGETIFPLIPPKKGRSRTQVDTAFDHLRTSEYAITISAASESSDDDPVACAEVVSEEP